jgi:hypothetical protein
LIGSLSSDGQPVAGQTLTISQQITGSPKHGARPFAALMTIPFANGAVGPVQLEPILRRYGEQRLDAGKTRAGVHR